MIKINSQKKLEKTKKTIYKPLKQNIVSPDYQRCETVLSKEFQVDQVKYVKDLPEVKDPGIKKREDDKKDREKLFDPAKTKVNGVNGTPNIVEEPSNHCALKMRKYKIIKPDNPGVILVNLKMEKFNMIIVMVKIIMKDVVNQEIYVNVI